jgi:uncharacterized protein
MSETNSLEDQGPKGINSRRNSTFVVVGVGLVLLIVFIFQWVLNDDQYLIEEQSWRTQRDEIFKSAPESPIPDSLKAQFKALNWFAVNPNYKIVAKFEQNPEFQRIEMPRSQSKPETYIIAGWVNFKVYDKPCKLTAYQPNAKDSKTLFIPFRDATTGKETYGGGRYIDTRLADDKVILDFNRAYNPYCVYNYSYACPIPPAENTLTVAIEAGEKDFQWASTTKVH